MAELRQAAIQDLEALATAADACIAQLQAARRAYEVGLEELRSGSPVTRALAVGRAPEMRRDVTASMDALERARKQSRVSLILADLAEGSSVKDVADEWGVSRQLIARYVAESKSGPDAA